jgi:alpha-beta hydrolase superfamily lysophospholipase
LLAISHSELTAHTLRRILGRVAIGVVCLPIAVYLGAIVYLRVRESSLVFAREGGLATLKPPADSLHLPYRAVVILTEDSVRLGAWIIPASHPDSNGMWVLLCHGQTGNVATTTRPEYYADLRTTGVNTLAFDWRGFGTSSGLPTEEGLYRDATAAYRYLRDSLHVAADHIVIFGHSLGTAPAIELATRVPAAGLIVEGAPSSVRERGAELYPWLPVRYVARVEYNSLSRIGKVRMPILFMHARADERIPVAHERRLYAAATAQKEFVELGGTHSDAFKRDSATYFGAYRRFVDQLKSGSGR